jgi:hypothetical protein
VHAPVATFFPALALESHGLLSGSQFLDTLTGKRSSLSVTSNVWLIFALCSKFTLKEEMARCSSAGHKLKYYYAIPADAD